MQRLALSICSRCRLSLFLSAHPEQWLSENGQHFTRRFRSGDWSSRKRTPDRDGAAQRPYQFRPNTFPSFRTVTRPPQVASETRILPQDIPIFVRDYVNTWVKFPKVRWRLEAFGIPRSDIPILLNEFASTIRSDQLLAEEGYNKFNLSRFSDSSPSGKKSEYVDRIFSSMFFTWASEPGRESSLKSIVPSSTIFHIRRLQEAVDLSYPAEFFPYARKMRRKIIMHVGPTNSGKTHNALRALASANAGLYAGPLRLLAHEVWERLNKGQIVPLHAEPKSGTNARTDTGLDVSDESKNGTSAVVKDGNPKYARPCNLITGEEQRIVMEGAPLLSATVEMVSFSADYDVAVVDEIQMVADPERGGAWTNAVLGLAAKELHLCGEETAVPVIEEILKDTGDDLVVHRYQRLTPLVVENESLEGDLGRVRKGDCIVTFSRTNIFAIKRRVEEITGLRCAVAYGRLPPEIRSEQAALFNDPNSGYDVIIGSDAIGMGLNLKIKRIVFEAIWKWDGRIERLLSTSQIKQIAGRAGRYGLHGDDSPGGFVTTLYPRDLPVLRDALAYPLRPIEHVYISGSADVFVDVSQVLPARSSTQTMYEVHVYIAKMRPIYRFEEFPNLHERCHFLDSLAGELTLDDRDLLMKAPIPWRDPLSLEVVAQFMRMYRTALRVILSQAFRGTDFLNRLRGIEQLMRTDSPPTSSPSTLSILETFHKVLVLYIWLSFRNPVTFCDHTEATELKDRVEKALDWCLKGVSWERLKRLGTGHSGEAEGRHLIRRRPQRKMAVMNDRRPRRQPLA